MHCPADSEYEVRSLPAVGGSLCSSTTFTAISHSHLSSRQQQLRVGPSSPQSNSSPTTVHLADFNSRNRCQRSFRPILRCCSWAESLKRPLRHIPATICQRLDCPSVPKTPPFPIPNTSLVPHTRRTAPERAFTHQSTSPNRYLGVRSTFLRVSHAQHSKLAGLKSHHHSSSHLSNHDIEPPS